MSDKRPDTNEVEIRIHVINSLLRIFINVMRIKNHDNWKTISQIDLLKLNECIYEVDKQ